MKNQSGKNKNYKKDLILLIKTQYPMFILGMTTMMVIFAVTLQTSIISINFPFKKIQKQKPKIQNKNIIHTVASGEDLWGIAEKYFGSGFNAYDIAQANNLKEPYVLELNQKLQIPSVAKREPTQGDITASSAATTRVMFQENMYTVKQGEYLFQIAEDVYGDGNMMNRIIEANSIPYPYDVLEGQKLQIPR